MSQNHYPKDCETNVYTEQMGKKSITTISDMIETTNENGKYRNQNHVAKDGCDNKLMDSP